MVSAVRRRVSRVVASAAAVCLLAACWGCGGGGSTTTVTHVTQVTPVITWPTPAAISQGTPLSATQLDATANVAGTFAYSPAAGTVLAAGNQALSVTFTPTDTVDYTTASASVTLQVVPAGTNAKYNWLPVKIVDGGVMTGILLHPTQQGLMYTRGNVGGAYLRNTANPTWLPLTDWISGLAPEWNLMYIESIAVDPTDVNRLYLAAGSYLWPGNPNGAVLVSDDQGSSFQTVNMPFQMGGNDDHGQQTGERLAVNPFNPAQVYLGTHRNGLWVSNDHGATWNQSATFPVTSTPDLAGVLFVRFDPAHNGVVYAGVYSGGIYRSTDNGVTWAQIPGQPATLPDGETIRPLRSALGPDGILYVAYANAAGLSAISNGAVYKFNTASGVWTNVTPPDSPAQLWYGYCAIAADPEHAGTVMAGTWNRWSPGDDIFRSTDGGATWKSLRQYSTRDASSSPYLNFVGGSTFGIWNSAIEIDPFDSNHALYVSGDTIWETHNLTAMDSLQTTQWTVGALGVEETVIHNVVSPPAGAHLLSAIADVGGFRHDDFAVSPPPMVNPFMIEVSSLDFAESNPSFMARVGELDYVGDVQAAYSQDGGGTWTPYPGLPPGAGLGPTADGYAAQIAVSADGAKVIWATSNSLPAYFNGAGWTSSKGAPSGVRVISDRVNPKKFYGYDPASGAMFVSTDGGVTFSAGATGLPQDVGNLGWTAEAHPKAVFGIEGNLWLPFPTAGLYHSTDSGASFTKIGSVSSAPLVGLGMAAPGATYPAIYIVGTVGGVYGFFRSTDEGNSWTRINDDAHQYGYIFSISGDPRIYGRVYLGTGGRGILYGDIATAHP